MAHIDNSAPSLDSIRRKRFTSRRTIASVRRTMTWRRLAPSRQRRRFCAKGGQGEEVHRR